MAHADLETRARALVDDNLIRAHWELVEHCKTRDPVLIYVVGDSFWLLAIFSDEEAACLVVNPKLIASGGRA